MPKILTQIPPAMLIQMDNVASREHRTRASLVREAVRRYCLASERDPNVVGLRDELVCTRPSQLAPGSIIGIND